MHKTNLFMRAHDLWHPHWFSLNELSIIELAESMNGSRTELPASTNTEPVTLHFAHVSLLLHKNDGGGGNISGNALRQSLIQVSLTIHSSVGSNQKETRVFVVSPSLNRREETAKAFFLFDISRSAWKAFENWIINICHHHNSYFAAQVKKKCLRSQRFCHKYFTTFLRPSLFQKQYRKGSVIVAHFADTKRRIISFNAFTFASSAKSSIQSSGWRENWKNLRCEGTERARVCYQDVRRGCKCDTLPS